MSSEHAGTSARVEPIVRQSVQGEPESQETVDASFSTANLDAIGIAEMIDKVMVGVRNEASSLVSKWFRKHGYFNGRAEGFVDHDEENDEITCRVVVSCYGLPELTRLAIDPFTNESKRYPVDAALPEGWRWF